MIFKQKGGKRAEEGKQGAIDSPLPAKLLEKYPVGWIL